MVAELMKSAKTRMSKPTATLVLLCALVSSPAWAQHKLAFSDKVGVDVFANGNPWCDSFLKLELKLRSGSSLDRSEDVLEFIQKLKTPIESDCPSAREAVITVSGEVPTTVAGTIVATKQNGWFGQISSAASADKTAREISNQSDASSAVLAKPNCEFGQKVNEKGTKYLLTDIFRNLPFTSTEASQANDLAKAFKAPPVLEWTSREINFVKTWFADCAATTKSGLRVPRGPEGIAVLNARDSLSANEKNVSRALDRQLKEVNEVRRAGDLFFTQEAARLSKLKVDGSNAVQLASWSVPAEYRRVFTQEEISDRVKTSVFPIIDASLTSYLESLSPNPESYRIIRSGCCQWAYGGLRAPSDAYLDRVRSRLSQSSNENKPREAGGKADSSQSPDRVPVERSTGSGVADAIGGIALILIAAFGVFNLYKHARLKPLAENNNSVPNAGISFSSNPINLILNLIWLIPIGAILAIGWLISAAFLAASIIGLPWAVAALTLSSLAAWPFGRDVIKRTDLTGAPEIAGGGLNLIGNIIWFSLAGLWLALAHVSAGLVACVTLIGIPFGIQHFKLAGTAIAPVGKIVVSKELAAEVRRQRASQSINAFRSTSPTNA
jgi:uncharacterized membrane protein YccF (DUF307 family)